MYRRRRSVSLLCGKGAAAARARLLPVDRYYPERARIYTHCSRAPYLLSGTTPLLRSLGAGDGAFRRLTHGVAYIYIYIHVYARLNHNI